MFRNVGMERYDAKAGSWKRVDEIECEGGNVVSARSLLVSFVLRFTDSIRTIVQESEIFVDAKGIEGDVLDSKDSLRFWQTRTIDNLGDSACSSTFPKRDTRR
jgi:hypothetical protein